jgi:ZIP family zinc transporter
MESPVIAFILTLIAGASTGIGGILGILRRQSHRKFISFIMSFSAGVMVFISFVEMYGEAQHVIGDALALLLLAVGLGVALCIDLLLPEKENVHEHFTDSDLLHANGKPSSEPEVNSPPPFVTAPPVIIPEPLGLNAPPPPNMGHHHRHRGWRHQQETDAKICAQLFCVDNPKLMKLGIFTMLALAIHNLPEGLATFSAGLISTQLGVQIAIAIMLHNIPEGLSISIPIYTATGDKKRAFGYAFISGLAEPFGALLAWLFLYRIMSNAILMGLLAFVAGIMVYVSVDTLIPTAKAIEYKHTAILGFAAGMIVMGISLLIQ